MARTGRSMNHMRNFLDCVKTRQPTVANPEVMHHSMTTVHAANICMWLKRNLKYDPVKEEFVNDAEANRLPLAGHAGTVRVLAPNWSAPRFLARFVGGVPRRPSEGKRRQIAAFQRDRRTSLSKENSTLCGKAH